MRSLKEQALVFYSLAKSDETLHPILMKSILNLLSFATLMLLVSSPAAAIPDDAAEMRKLLLSEYAGSAIDYVNDDPGDFRSIGCRGRVDLLEVLVEHGLVLFQVDSHPRFQFISCSLYQSDGEGLALVIDPDSVSRFEDTIEASVRRQIN